jgi:hypothetical protein
MNDNEGQGVGDRKAWPEISTIVIILATVGAVGYYIVKNL